MTAPKEIKIVAAQKSALIKLKKNNFLGQNVNNDI
jgi:hypothetical protein